MKFELLGREKSLYKTGTVWRIVICAIVAFAAIAVNILLAVLRSDNTHTAFMIVNILADIAAFCFVFFFASMVIAPRKKLYALVAREAFGSVLCGTIVSISENTETVNGLPCYSAELNADGVKKIFIVGNGCIPNDLCGDVKVNVVDNIAVAVEIENGQA